MEYRASRQNIGLLQGSPRFVGVHGVDSIGALTIRRVFL